MPLCLFSLLCAKVDHAKGAQVQERIFGGKNTLDEGLWSEFATDNVFLSKAYVGLLLARNPSARAHIYYIDGLAIGKAVFQPIKACAPELGSLFPDKGVLGKILPLLRKTKKDFEQDVLLCGSALTTGQHGFAFAESVSKNDAAELLLDSMQSLADQQKIKVLATKDFLAGTQSETAFHDRMTKFDSGDSMRLALDPKWQTFDDYLSALTSKFRTKAKAAFGRSSVLKQKNLSAEDCKTYGKEMHQLHKNVLNQATFILENSDPALFHELKNTLGELLQVEAFFDEGKMVGFSLALRNGNAIEAKMVGLDYNFNKKYALYSTMLYNYIKHGISVGASQINFSRTAEEIKSTVGAKPVAMDCYLMHTNFAKNSILAAGMRKLRLEKPPIRNPFKKVD